MLSAVLGDALGAPCGVPGIHGCRRVRRDRHSRYQWVGGGSSSAAPNTYTMVFLGETRRNQQTQNTKNKKTHDGQIGLLPCSQCSFPVSPLDVRTGENFLFFSVRERLTPEEVVDECAREESYAGEHGRRRKFRQKKR